MNNLLEGKYYKLKRLDIRNCCIDTIGLNGKQFHADENGKPLYEERYDYISMFDDEIAIAKLDGKYFHIGRNGKPLYEERYDYISFFDNNAAVAALNNKYSHIDKNGKPLYEERYDWVSMFNDGIASVRLNDKWFHIDKNGKPLYEERYDCVSMFDDDNIATAKLDDDKLFYIDKNGNRLPYKSIPNIGSRNDTLYIVNNNNVDIFKTGCFSGTLEEFEAAVRKTHMTFTHPYKEYMKIIEEYKERGNNMEKKFLSMNISIRIKPSNQISTKEILKAGLVSIGGFSFDYENKDGDVSSLPFDFDAFTITYNEENDTLEYRGGKGLFFNDYSISECYDEMILDAGFDIYDITPELMGNPIKIIELYFDVSKDNEQIELEEFELIDLYFNSDKPGSEVHISKSVIDDLNKNWKERTGYVV